MWRVTYHKLEKSTPLHCTLSLSLSYLSFHVFITAYHFVSFILWFIFKFKISFSAFIKLCLKWSCGYVLSILIKSRKKKLEMPCKLTIASLNTWVFFFFFNSILFLIYVFSFVFNIILIKFSQNSWIGNLFTLNTYFGILFQIKIE